MSQQSLPPGSWQNFWKVPPCQCKGDCKLVEAGGIECCHTCGWDDWPSAQEAGEFQKYPATTPNTNNMDTHKLKTHPAVFQDVWNGSKGFEFRINDRNFKRGDVLVLEEWSPTATGYSGRTVTANVTYILHGGQYGVPEGYCIMQMHEINRNESQKG